MQCQGLEALTKSLFIWLKKVWRNSAVWGILLFQFPKYLFRLGYLVSKICSHSSLVSGGHSSLSPLISGCRHTVSRLHSPIHGQIFSTYWALHHGCLTVSASKLLPGGLAVSRIRWDGKTGFRVEFCCILIWKMHFYNLIGLILGYGQI